MPAGRRRSGRSAADDIDDQRLRRGLADHREYLAALDKEIAGSLPDGSMHRRQIQCAEIAPRPPRLPSLMPVDYLQKILTAKVYDVAIESPLDLAPALSRRLGNRVLLKREDQQPVFSFKLRGAYKMAHLSPAERARRIAPPRATMAGRGAGRAETNCKATIVMPVTTPHIKIGAVAARAAHVVLHGDSYSDAYAHALVLQKRTQATFVHPYDDPDVIAGQGTIGMEILRQWQGPLDAIFVAIGGGGLVSGIASYVKRVRPEIR
jgi:threonine dehydratase